MQKNIFTPLFRTIDKVFFGIEDFDELEKQKKLEAQQHEYEEDEEEEDEDDEDDYYIERSNN